MGGVEVFGSEWSYGSLGVTCDLPRCVEGHAYRCSVLLDDTQLTQQEFAAYALEMSRTWLGADYDIVSRNCCSFAAEICRCLKIGSMPPWVDRFPRLLDQG